ncbi:hypothetical protein IFM89_010234 [Coptis chinensis]|uniref:Uncharacterized protein n=1 Tax=Coptis chinensis TaxID=261450 RepID=A0A835INP3_9MAGN|nr:hypothetical protein IFM89_010234 [Coptis chinensis]
MGGLVNASTGKKSDVLIEIPNRQRNDSAQAVKRIQIEEIDDDTQKTQLTGVEGGKLREAHFILEVDIYSYCTYLQNRSISVL